LVIFAKFIYYNNFYSSIQLYKYRHKLNWLNKIKGEKIKITKMNFYTKIEFEKYWDANIV
jgi:hypothetical protein